MGRYSKKQSKKLEQVEGLTASLGVSLVLLNLIRVRIHAVRSERQTLDPALEELHKVEQLILAVQAELPDLLPAVARK